MVEPITSARLSAIAYSDTIQSIDKYKFIKRIIKQETNTSCNIYKKGQQILITFEGTDSIRDLPFILNFKKTRFGETDAKIHRGFLKAYMSIHEDIVNSLKRYKINAIHCCGHSLGGALSEISVLFLKDVCSNISVHTFAGPRVGNSIASKLIYDSCTDFKRFVIKGDPIPHLPPFFFNFRHFSEEITLDKINSKIIDSYLYNAVNNHKIVNYIKSVMIWTMERKVIIETSTE